MVGTFECNFFRVGMKAEPRAAREASTDAPIVGLARLPHPGAAHKDAFRPFVEQECNSMDFLLARVCPENWLE